MVATAKVNPLASVPHPEGSVMLGSRHIVTVVHYALLCMIDKQGRHRSIQQYATLLELPYNMVYKGLKKLEDEGYVQRNASFNRQLTQRGVTLMDSCWSLYNRSEKNERKRN